MSKKDRVFVFHLLQQANGTLFRAADRLMRDSEGITTAHQVILFSLCIEDGVTPSALATRLNMGKSRLTGLLDTLEEKAMVRRVRDVEDGRSQQLMITPEGRGVIDRSKAAVGAMNEDLLAPFSDTERATIGAFLTRVRDEGEAIVSRHGRGDGEVKA